MSGAPHKVVSDENWNQLMTLASGYLSLEGGDVQAAMSRAIAAHAELIRALKDERIHADLPGGRVTMFVPDEGGVALRTQRTEEEVREDVAALVNAPTEIEDPPPALPGVTPVVPPALREGEG